MRTVARVMEVARSNLVNQVSGAGKSRTRYTVQDDKWLLPMIQEVTAKRPTYGYRRVAALLNLELLKVGKNGVNQYIVIPPHIARKYLTKFVSCRRFGDRQKAPKPFRDIARYREESAE